MEEKMAPITRREVFLAKASGQEVETPTPVTREEVFLDAIAKGGGGGSSLPSVTSADNGKVLAVEDGEWAASEQGKKFIVTLTPTSLDLSGTMDKTVAEINSAYEAGKDIWFSVSVGAATLNAKLALVTDINAAYPMFTFFTIDTNNNVLIVGYNNSYTDDADTYGTVIYSLTPAS